MFKHISAKELALLMTKEKVMLADVRDQASYNASHISGAEQVSMDRLSAFCDNAARTQLVVVYCYHGISSQTVAQFLVGEGFEHVYSLEGGFESWRSMSTEEL